MTKPLVSIICTTYNHEKYIKKCLDGFVMQKIDFPIEIIVHDDASTDKTADIIKEYQKKYPHLFKCIFQEKNLYSQGYDIFEIIKPLISGKYVAFCEGDDFWIDENKLQLQFDYLQKNPNCSLCVHNANKYLVSTGETILQTTCDEEKDYSIEEIVEGGGALFATNSIFAKKEIATEQPKCFYCPRVSDFQIIIYGAFCGTVHYLPFIMSQYNCGTSGSWTERFMSDPSEKKKHYIDLVNMLQNIDEYYDYRYHELFLKKEHEIEFTMFFYERNFKQLKKRKYREYYLPHKKELRSYEKSIKYAKFVIAVKKIMKLKIVSLAYFL